MYDYWDLGTVTRIISNVNVEVDGMPRHVADLRARANVAQREIPRMDARSDSVDDDSSGDSLADSSSDSPDESSDESPVGNLRPVPPPAQVVNALRRSTRVSQPPAFFSEFDRT